MNNCKIKKKWWVKKQTLEYKNIYAWYYLKVTFRMTIIKLFLSMVMIIRAKLVANQPHGLPFMTDVKQQVPVKSEFHNQTTRVTKEQKEKKN